jgi:hypothetical protein
MLTHLIADAFEKLHFYFRREGSFVLIEGTAKRRNAPTDRAPFAPALCRGENLWGPYLCCQFSAAARK